MSTEENSSTIKPKLSRTSMLPDPGFVDLLEELRLQQSSTSQQEKGDEGIDVGAELKVVVK
jgi:hypothetical protein